MTALILAQSNYDHYARECDFVILNKRTKTKQKQNKKSFDCVFDTVCLLGSSCRTATLDFFFDLAESKVAVFLCSILTSDGVPLYFGKNSFP